MYLIFRIPQVGVAVIPDYTLELLLEVAPTSEQLFEGNWDQCMVYMIHPISLN
jgi:hypothetical protein